MIKPSLGYVNATACGYQLQVPLVVRGIVLSHQYAGLLHAGFMPALCSIANITCIESVNPLTAPQQYGVIRHIPLPEPRK